MQLIAGVVPVVAALLTSLAIGWLIGPSLQERLDEIAPGDRWRGKPIRVFSACVAALPFASLGDSANAWIFWSAALAGWLPGLLRRADAGVPRVPLRDAAPGGDRIASDVAAVEAIVEAIDRLLPQTQCGQCGHPGCRPYATAIASGTADINQCPPGGETGIRALAELLGRDPKPLNPANGVEKPKVVALIVEEDCIGCTKCIQACPVDAIIGAPKRMHTVIADLCTGCELCLPPCPVDCIDLVPPPQAAAAQWTPAQPVQTRSTL